MGGLGISMFFVGATLCLNGLWLLKKVNVKSVGVFNLLVGSLCTLIAINNHFKATELAEHLSAANTLLFAFTYLLVGINCLYDLDSKALGWYSLYVALATMPNMIFHLTVAKDFKFAFIWFGWGVLWFCFFLSLSLNIQRVTNILPVLSIIIGLLLTGIPGYLILWDKW